MLLAYWGLLGSLSVAGWNRQLARSRRYRSRNNTVVDNVIVPGAHHESATGQYSDPSRPSTPPPTVTGSAALGLTFPNLPVLPTGADVSNAATDFLDAADKHVPTLSLNARRKFFHGLAVVMFIPGIASDVSVPYL